MPSTGSSRRDRPAPGPASDRPPPRRTRPPAGPPPARRDRSPRSGGAGPDATGPAASARPPICRSTARAYWARSFVPMLANAATSKIWSASIAADGTSTITPAVPSPCAVASARNHSVSSTSATIGAITQTSALVSPGRDRDRRQLGTQNLRLPPQRAQTAYPRGGVDLRLLGQEPQRLVGTGIEHPHDHPAARKRGEHVAVGGDLTGLAREPWQRRETAARCGRGRRLRHPPRPPPARRRGRRRWREARSARRRRCGRDRSEPLALPRRARATRPRPDGRRPGTRPDRRARSCRRRGRSAPAQPTTAGIPRDRASTAV